MIVNRFISSVCFSLVLLTAVMGEEPVLLSSFKTESDEPEYVKSNMFVVFSPDGRTLATIWCGEVRLWDVTNGKAPTALCKLTGDCASVAFSPDGKTFAGSHDCRTIWLWDARLCKKIATVTTSNSVDTNGFHSPLAFKPDGRTLMTWNCNRDDKRAITFWDLKTRKNVGTVKLDIERCGRIIFSPDRRLFAANGFQKGRSAELWDVAAGKKIFMLKGHGNSDLDLAFSPDGKTLACAIEDTVELWDVATGKNVSTLKSNSKYVDGLAFSPDGRTLALGHPYDPVVELWDVASNKRITMLKGRGKDSINTLSFSPDGKMLASGGPDSTLELWTWPEKGPEKGVRNHLSSHHPHLFPEKRFLKPLLAVESTHDSGEVAPVYNMRVEEYHTYFVGNAEGGFSVRKRCQEPFSGNDGGR
jgi:WD40 repeat protein